jgi:hypothetical protein
MKFYCEKNRRSFHFHRRYENAIGVIHKVLFFFQRKTIIGAFIYARKYLGLSNSFNFYVCQEESKR